MGKLNPDSIMPGLGEKPGGYFAAILIHEKVLSLAKIKKAGRVQEKLGSTKLLSTILIELNMLTESDHRRLLHRHGHEFRIGDSFVSLATLHWNSF